MENNVVIKNGVGTMSAAELVSIKQQMNHNGTCQKTDTKMALRLAANVMVGAVILLPLLYAISIAFMPSNELYTLDMNLLPKKPTFQNFIDAFKNVPLLRFIGNSFLVASLITVGQIITCSLAAFAFSFLDFKGKGVLFMVVVQL